jgi:hypothetical protein
MGHFPHLKDFVEHKMADYPRVDVEYIRGQAPQLRVFAQGDGAEEVVPIASWKPEHLDEFLASRLAKE